MKALWRADEFLETAPCSWPLIDNGTDPPIHAILRSRHVGQGDRPARDGKVFS